MKKGKYIILISILLGLSNILVSANAPDESRLKNIHYENSIGEKGVTHLYYSLENKNYKAKWELLDGSRYSINYHFLDDNGNLIRKYREFSDSITSNNFYKYDVDGNLIEDYFERSDKVKGIVWYKYKNGKKIEAECRGLNGWFFGFIQYVYRENILFKAFILQDGNRIGSIDYKYDEYGNLISEFWDFTDRWTQTFTYEYETLNNAAPESYNYSSPFLNPTKSFIVKKENYDWNGEQGGPSIYEYDKNKLVRKIYKYDSLETITKYEYDNDGLLMKSFRHYSDGRKAEFSYHYNENTQLIRRLFHGANGFEGSESYEYNEKGKLNLAKLNKFDTWISGTMTFSYDKSGQLETGQFNAEKYNATLDFELDKNGNLNKILWNFSFGKTQSYWFEYDKL